MTQFGKFQLAILVAVSDDGKFDPDEFKKKSRLEQIKMIEIKLSQGAKPGHGGMLMAPKVTPEIAETRACQFTKIVYHHQNILSSQIQMNCSILSKNCVNYLEENLSVSNSALGIHGNL